MRYFYCAVPSLRTFLAFVYVIANGSLGLAQSAQSEDDYLVQGFSQPSRISKVASSIQGIVESLDVREGEQVRKGDCMLRMDCSVHQTRLEFARIAKDSSGELDAAKAEHAAHETRLMRLKELASRKHATQVELLQAEEDVAISLANIRRAQDRLDQQAADYARLLAESKQYCIAAPFDGVLIEFNKQVGEYIGPGESTVCTIADLDTLLVEFLVPGYLRQSLKADDEVRVHFTTTDRFVAGTIVYVSPFPNGETNTYKLKVKVDNASRELNAGERCQLSGLHHPNSNPGPLAFEPVQTPRQ